MIHLTCAGVGSGPFYASKRPGGSPNLDAFFKNRSKSTPPHWKVILRLQLAMQSIQRPVRVNGYVVVKGKGAFTTGELADAQYDPSRLSTAGAESEDWPAVDFHVHPKMPDLKFLSDMRKAGVRHAVILATDTDPEDVDRPEIVEKLKSAYAESAHSQSTEFAQFLKTIRADLYSRTHVTDQDVADWVADYPDTLTGFGSVNLCKTSDYVERKLDRIQQLGLRGIKLLPYSQFFNPAENVNMDMLFEYCRKTGSIVLTHSGCAAGAAWHLRGPDSAGIPTRHSGSPWP